MIYAVYQKKKKINAIAFEREIIISACPSIYVPLYHNDQLAPVSMPFTISSA